MDLDVVQAQVLDNLLEELGAAQERLQQLNLHIRSRDSQGDTRQARTGADVDDSFAVLDDLLEHRRVHDVAIPDARHFARADEPTLDPRSLEPLGVTLG